MLNYLQTLELNCLFESALHVPVHQVAFGFLGAALRKCFLKTVQVVLGGVVDQSFALGHELEELLLVVLFKTFDLVPYRSKMKLNLPHLH